MNSKETNNPKIEKKRIETSSRNTESIKGRDTNKYPVQVKKSVHCRELHSDINENDFRCLGTGPGLKLKDHKK